jgi:hypothetical protein
MGTQYENITVTISGVNPQTKVVSVPVDTTTGSGSATVTYTGVNGGSDSLIATGTIAGTNYTSPAALVNWQTSNGQLQIGPVTAYMWNDSKHSGPVQQYPKFNPGDPQVAALGIPSNTTASSSPSGFAVLSNSYGYVGSSTGNSLMFDVTGAGDPTDTMWETLGPTGAFLGTTDPFPGTQQNWNMVLLTNLLVPTAGSHTLNVLNKNCVNVGVGGRFGGAPFLSPITGLAGQTLSAYSGLPLLGSVSGNNVPYPQPITPLTANYPYAGVYPIEINWDFWYHSGRSLQITGDGGAILTPVSSVISVPASSTPSGHLIITPAGGPTNFGFTGNTITLTVQVSGITFTSKSYCPVLEGQTGNLTLYNDPSNPVFNFQTYNGQPVSKTAAVSAGVFSLSSADNSAYSGLFAVRFDGTNFNLNYNGNTANPNNASRVVSTSLIVAAADIAWFNSVNNAFDLYAVSGTTGGVTYNFEVDYMNRPSVSSISPTTVNADGHSYTLAIALNKAFSPQQQGGFNTGNTVNCTCSISGATSTGTPVAVIGSDGWLTGWNVPFTSPVATTNQTLTVNLTVSGTLTYLSGNTFVTNTVTYVNGAVGTITANGTSFVAPTAYSFSTSPSGPAFSDLLTSVTATAQVFTAGGNDSVTCTFIYQPVGGSTKYTLGTGILQSSNPATVGGVSGYLHTFALTFNPNAYLNYVGDYLGFNATDNVSSLTCSYTSTTVYYLYTSGGGGGGGGGY